MIWSWSLFSRLHYIDGHSFLGSFRRGYTTFSKKFYKIIGIGWFLIGIHVVLMFLYYSIMEDRGTPSWGVVLFGILVQQLLAMIRVALRGFGYALVKDLHTK